MTHLFQILCPSINCRKCKKIIGSLEKSIKELQIEAKIEIVTELEIMMNFQTWILPSVFLDKKPLARGFTPNKEDILTILNK